METYTQPRYEQITAAVVADDKMLDGKLFGRRTRVYTRLPVPRLFRCTIVDGGFRPTDVPDPVRVVETGRPRLNFEDTDRSGDKARLGSAPCGLCYYFLNREA